jgi:hypothetical protein
MSSTLNAAAIEALARAYDREDASQRGEPDPWDDGKDDAAWVAERLACAQAGFAALSASQEAAAPSEEPGDAPENIIDNPKSWAAWKREAERLLREELEPLRRRNAELMSTLSMMAGGA